MSIDLAITHYDGICNTPALPLAVEGWSAILQAGHADGVMMLNWDDQAILAIQGESPVGIIVWQKMVWARQAAIKIGYVVPACRRQGVYRRLWDALLLKVQQIDGILDIVGSSAANNTAMASVADGLGRERYGYVLRYRFA